MDDECSHVLDMDKIIELEGDERSPVNPYADDIQVEDEDDDNNS